MTARALVVKALVRVEEQGAYSNLVLDGELSRSGLDSRDKAFASALFYTTLERLVTLDACIASQSSRPLGKLSPQVLAILRISVCQLLYMPQIPPSAVVDEGVKLTRQNRQASAGGFVNGVLRSFLRGGCALPTPPEEGEALAIQYGVPRPLVELWLRSYGREDTEGFLKRCQPPAPLYIRVNRLRIDEEALAARLAEEGVTARPVDGLEGAMVLEGGGDLRRLRAFEEGLFHVQDLSSQLCAKALETRPGMAVLDVCAAPGGKTFTLAQWMEDRGRLVACDLHPKRVGLIAKGARRLGLHCVEALAADGSVWEESRGRFDRVLCDVPCSGYGILRRKPEVRYKPLEETAGLPAIQYKILETSAKYTKEGGLLLYSTCTLHPRENQQVVERFLQAHPEFSPHPLTAIGVEEGQLTLINTRWDSDGFFLAALERTGQPGGRPTK